MMPAPITLATQSPAASLDGKPISRALNGFRRPQQPHGHFRHHAQQAFRPGHDAKQIISFRIEMLAADADDLPIDQHDFEAQQVIGRQPVFQAMHAA